MVSRCPQPGSPVTVSEEPQGDNYQQGPGNLNSNPGTDLCRPCDLGKPYLLACVSVSSSLEGWNRWCQISEGCGTRPGTREGSKIWQLCENGKGCGGQKACDSLRTRLCSEPSWCSQQPGSATSAAFFTILGLLSTDRWFDFIHYLSKSSLDCKCPKGKTGAPSSFHPQCRTQSLLTGRTWALVAE